MSGYSDFAKSLPDDQRVILEKCYHPVGKWIEFQMGDIEQSIPERFEGQVEKYADRLAVKSKKYKITYEELNQQSNQLARAIMELDTGSNSPVAIYLDNDAPAVAAIIGVLKSGNFFVPLDPSFPADRLRYYLRDSGTNLIITDNQHSSLVGKFADSSQAILNIDTLSPSLSTDNLRIAISPDRLAYIYYTSGTSGLPKGIYSSHRNLLHHVMRVTNNYHLCADDRLSCVRSFSFSGALKDIFCSLLNGASLHPFDIRQEGIANMRTWLAEEGITIYVSVVTTFRMLAEALRGNDIFPAVRKIHIGGESLRGREIEEYKKFFSGDCILSLGLDTSESGNTTVYYFDKHSESEFQDIPAGYPLQDMEFRILDESLQELGFDQVGQIGVCSPYLVKGYWNKPELTDKHFVPDPHAKYERIYLTGDLGYVNQAGCLFVVGRTDFQIKHLGHRIQPKEIENALLEHGSINEALVISREFRSGDYRLVGYLKSSSENIPTVTELKLFLANLIADYLIPSAFVFLDEFPRTQHGKVDRRALPTPGSSRPNLDIPFLAPKTQIQERLVSIWSQVLGIDPIGIHDNFFELGGQSLLATQVISQIRDKFNVGLSINMIFEMPTISQLATIIEQRRGSAGFSELPGISPVSRDDYRVDQK